MSTRQLISRDLVFSFIVTLMLVSLSLLGVTELFGCTLSGATGNATLSGNDTYIACSGDNPWGYPTRPGTEYRKGTINMRTHVVVNATPDKYKFIGTLIGGKPEYAVIAALSRGMNEKGLCFVRAGALSTEPITQGGITPLAIGYELMMNYATVDEAINFFKTVPKAASNNYVIADALGNIASIEFSSQTVNVFYKTNNGVTGITNHYVSEKMVPFMPADIGTRILFGCTTFTSSKQRLERVMELLNANKGKIDLQVMMSIYRDRKNGEVGGSICNYSSIGGSTNSSIIEPKKLTFWYTFGIPCPNPETTKFGWDMGASWGTYLPFHLPSIMQGKYGQWDLTTEFGQFTPFGIEALYVPSAPYKSK